MAESIEVDTFAHHNPLPAAARVGPMVWTSPVPPFVPQTKEVPEGLQAQARQIFDNMSAVLDAAGLDWSAVGKIDVWLRDPLDRGGLNDAWVERFADPLHRPARQVHDGSGSIPPGKVLVIATFVAYDGRT